MKALKHIKSETESQRICGAIYGCIIGDALAVPVAGMTKEDAHKTVGTITGFTTNFHHPFFYFLKPGQYGANMRLLLAVLEVLATHQAYDFAAIRESFLKIAKRSKEDYFYSRWMGVTIIKSLLSKTPSFSDSMTCVWGCIPLALLSSSWDEAKKLIITQTKLTHGSELSLSASYAVSYVLFQLKTGRRDVEAIFVEALRFIESEFEYEDISMLVDRLHLVLERKIDNYQEAKRVFGTGSVAHQSIPLAWYLTMHYHDNYEKAILLAANSNREDGPEEKQKLAYYSYVEELIQCRGGAGDVIGGIAGAYIGAYGGCHSIPKRFINEIEGRDEIRKYLSKITYFSSYEAK